MPATARPPRLRLDDHESATSWAESVQGTVVALPDGAVTPFAAFFGRAVSLTAALAGMFASADPPHSDAEAADRLRRAGYSVARRTVAKYRGRMRIAAAGTPRVPATPPAAATPRAPGTPGAAATSRANDAPAKVASG